MVVEDDSEIVVKFQPLLPSIVVAVPVLILIALVFVVAPSPALMLVFVLLFALFAIPAMTRVKLTITERGIVYRAGVGIFGVSKRIPKDEIIGLIFDEGGPPEDRNARTAHLVVTSTSEKGVRFTHILTGIRKDQAEWVIEAARLKMGDWQDGHAGQLLPGRAISRPVVQTSDP
jgi:uncharacterized membrane protein YdbT with pleckstrin-like domain